MSLTKHISHATGKALAVCYASVGLYIMKALNTIVNLVVLMLLLSSCSNDESKNVVESNGIKDNKLDTVRITINSFNLYSELKREMEAVICNDKNLVLSYNDDSLVPINRCETSGEIIDIRKRNIITITKDSVRAARRSNVIDNLEFELTKAYNNYGDDPFLPSSPDQMIIAIELESGDSTKILSELLKKLNFERQYKIWLR